MANLNLKGEYWNKEQNPHHPTAGLFTDWSKKNKEVFLKYFKVELFPGSLNVHFREPANLRENLDQKIPGPLITIPAKEIIDNPLGDGQAWRCLLQSEKIPDPINGWVFRRIGSRTPEGILELLFTVEIAKPYGLQDSDPIHLTLYEG